MTRLDEAMSRRHRRRTIAGASTAIVAAGALGLAMVSATDATAAARSSTVAVPQGIGAAALNGAAPQGTTNPDTKVRVSFVLKARNAAALRKQVTHGTRRHLGVPAFARTYGQKPSIIRALRTYLRGYGISSRVYRDRLDVTSVGTAAEFDRALSVQLSDYRVRETVPGNAGKKRTATVHATKKNPRLPRRVAKAVLSILGLSNYGPFTSHARPAMQQPRITPKADKIPAGMRVPADFVEHYGLGPLEQRGHKGQGQTIGIVTLASLDPSVPQTFWTKYLGMKSAPGRIRLADVDGGAGKVSAKAGSDETTLDVEQSGAIAPDSKVVVYQAPNTDNGFADAFFSAASQNVAGSVSASWGESETALRSLIAQGKASRTYAAAYDEAMLELAAQGQSTFVASGDAGAYTAAGDLGTTDLSVDNPSDSPYQTAAGGTTVPGKQTHTSKSDPKFSATVDIPKERAWGFDYMWPMYKVLGYSSEADFATDPSNAEGDGGGYSGIEPRPAYQNGVSGVSRYSFRKYLTPTNYSDKFGIKAPTAWRFDANPGMRHGVSAHGRAVPDVSANADPETGYALYDSDPEFVSEYGSDIVQFGGTSFVAPQLAGASAAINSRLGHRAGFWNPQIYRFAGRSNSPFTKLNSTKVYGSSHYSQTKDGKTSPLSGHFTNDNLYYTGTPGATYNPATGLGYPNLTALGDRLAGR